LREFDVLVIGSGQAGVPLAVKLAGEGRRVALFERGPLGGTCVNVGCTPTKTLVASARAAHVARTSGRLGVRIADVTVDFPAVMERMRRTVQQWRDGVERRIASAGDRLAVVRAAARFVGDRTIAADGERYTAPVVVLNVGARAVTPDLDGLADVPALDNAGILGLDALPRHLLVLGGGYVGCEFGQLFRRLGAAVSIVDPNAHLLSREDVDVSAAIENVFLREDIALHLGHGAERVSAAGGDILLTLTSGETLRGSHLLVATGRRPDTDDLGCDAGGVALDEDGAVRIDDRFRTAAPGVFAVGDVTGGPQFTHSSWDDHRILHDILSGGTRSAANRLVPYTVFTDPQVARVGVSQREAAANGSAFETALLPFAHIARAIETDETAGLVKILIDPATERILGAAIVGAEAGELIHIPLAAMLTGASARALVNGQFVHPTLAEGVQSALLRLERFAP
jgi:pyruvate/2-oxoglutarate dehydrogenase complex dihydrolipoamide dehydrogenase (E3) component